MGQVLLWIVAYTVLTIVQWIMMHCLPRSEMSNSEQLIYIDGGRGLKEGGVKHQDLDNRIGEIGKLKMFPISR